MSSFIGPGYSGGGSSIGSPLGPDVTFPDTGLNVTLASQAAGIADPADSPAVSKLRAVKGADGKYSLQVWDLAGAVWVGVELL